MIIEVKQKWPVNKLRIEIMIGNTCNYKCWYCFPGSNEGTDRWPTKFDLFKENISHLLKYYQIHAKKEVFEIHLIGGEPTLWPELGKFVKYLKETFNVIISISTNGSRTERWWREYGHYFDKVLISCHFEKIDTAHVAKIGDILYDKGVVVTGIVLMDPNNWDKCWNVLQEVLKSKRKWGVDIQEIIHDTVEIKYSEEQIKLLRKFRYRNPNWFYFLKNHKHTVLNTSVVFENGETKKIKNNEIVLNKWNNFRGWDCNLGIDSLFIDKAGNLRGSCGENLYNLPYQFNIKDLNFTKNFTPLIRTTTCNRDVCPCPPEANLNKRIIPILPQ